MLDSDHSGRRQGHMLGFDRCKCQLDSLVWMVFNSEYLCPPCAPFFPKMCVCPNRGCGGWHTQKSYSWHEHPRRKPRPSLPNFFTLHHMCQPPPCVSPELVCSFAWTSSFLSEGEVKERRLLMQLITSSLRLLPCLLKELWHPAGKDERLDYSQISKWAG